jgi:hypothetical protein
MMDPLFRLDQKRARVGADRPQLALRLLDGRGSVKPAAAWRSRWSYATPVCADSHNNRANPTCNQAPETRLPLRLRAA